MGIVAKEGAKKRGGRVHVKVLKFAGGNLKPKEDVYVFNLECGRLAAPIGGGNYLYVEGFDDTCAKLSLKNSAGLPVRQITAHRGIVHTFNINFIDFGVTVKVGVE